MATAHAQPPLQEYANNHGVSLRVDREAGKIHGVKIIGRTSRNGREYTQECLRLARGLYEGAKVNINHREGNGQRGYQDRFGHLSDVVEQNDGLYGVLNFNPKHALAEQLCWDAEKAPQNVGLSHDVPAGGYRAKASNGKQVIEHIAKLTSVDLVADPATTNGLFESTNMADQSLQEQIKAIVDGAGDATEKAAAIEKLMPSNVTEAVKQAGQVQGLQEQVATLTKKLADAERKSAVDKLVADHKLPATLRPLLEAAADDAARKVLVDSFNASLQEAKGTPVSKAREEGGDGVFGKLPTDPKDRIKALLG